MGDRRCGPCDGAMTLPSAGPPIAGSPVAKVSGVAHIVEGKDQPAACASGRVKSQ